MMSSQPHVISAKLHISAARRAMPATFLCAHAAHMFATSKGRHDGVPLWRSMGTPLPTRVIFAYC